MNPIQNLNIQIQKIQASGKVAPEKTWISSYNVPKKNGKRYTYYRLMTKHPSGKGSKMICYLGSKKSKAYKAMVLAIARRNQIQKLEKRIVRLEQMEMERVSMEIVSGVKKIKRPQLTYSEQTILLQIQTQINQIMEVLEELKAQQGTELGVSPAETLRERSYDFFKERIRV